MTRMSHTFPLALLCCFSWAVLKTDGRESQKRRIEPDGVRAWTLRFPILEIFGVSQKSNGEGAQGSIAGIPDLRLIDWYEPPPHHRG